MDKDTVQDIPIHRIQQNEERSRQMRSETIVEGFKALVSARLTKEREIELEPIIDDSGGECAA